MKILVINSGSSSIKYQIFDAGDFTVLAAGLLEQIGEDSSHLRHRWQNRAGEQEEYDQKKSIADHQQGFAWIIAVIAETGTIQEPGELIGIGHRVVHGGELFHEPTLIDDRTIRAIREMIPLAPLHNPANLIGIEVAMERRPDMPQVAVFDTAFHQSMPPHSFLYALSYDLYKKYHVRRYGFHGTSHHYVAEQAAAHLGQPLGHLNLITLHLGNGASAAAIKAGKSVDTSMGLTPLEGLVMGTRCGDLDPAIHFYLAREAGLSMEEVEALLNKQSGLKGICGVNDMREIIRLAESGDRQAQLAIDIYCYRIKKYIGAYFAVLGQVDALVFTGGIGENAALIRQRSCEDLNGLGIILDEQKNTSCAGTLMEVQDSRSKVSILVIPTNEELEIARQTLKCIRSQAMEG
jgi:acetate kinase